MISLRTIGILLAILPAQIALAETLNVAVAANFTQTLKQLQPLFEQQSGHQLKISSASTGTLYAQIVHGAPFDIFLAADTQRPQALIDDDRADAKSALIYARGVLVLWSPDENIITNDSSVLTRANFNHIAIANPNTAPYGIAAQQVIAHLDNLPPQYGVEKRASLRQKLSGKIVQGENIAQTWQFVVSGNAELGFIAKSQLIFSGRDNSGSHWEIPNSLYQPIEQMAVVVKSPDTSKLKAANNFMQFLRSNEAREVIRRYGYNVGDYSAKASTE